ncbi:MAG TPA: hypothetical protein PL188_08860 [Candidatus Cloacimonadota bacterium]|nr:hypothetical protein [Candidatus Cloacimonadota bacterium]
MRNTRFIWTMCQIYLVQADRCFIFTGLIRRTDRLKPVFRTRLSGRCASTHTGYARLHEPLRVSVNEDVYDPRTQGSKTLRYNRLKAYVTVTVTIQPCSSSMPPKHLPSRASDEYE